MKTINFYPKVSILIANYNNAPYLEKCINSVINQNYRNTEIIVIDDNSNDDSVKILNRFKQKIKIILNKKKKSLGFINQMRVYYLGFKKAKGDLVFFLDSDDYFSKFKISHIVNLYINNPNKKFFFDLPVIFNKDKKYYVKTRKIFFKRPWSYIYPTSCISIDKKILNKIFKLIYINKFSDIWMDFRIHLCVKYIFNDFCFVNKNLTFYRKIENSASSSFKFLTINWWKRRLQAYEYLFFFAKKNKLTVKKNFDFYVTKIINLFL